jgi:hypothetical protein
MTTSPQAHTVSPLKVVPPGATRPTPIESAERATTPATPEAPARSISKRKVFYAVVVVIGALGFIPLPVDVSGRAEAGLQEQNRQSVSMREAGWLELRVAARTSVRRGDVVAIIENDELTSQILEQERLLMDTQAAIKAAERRLAVAQAAAARSNTATNFDRQLLERKLAQLNDVEAGLGISETQRLEAEIEGLRSQAARQALEQDRFQSEALDLAEQRIKKQEQLEELFARREDLVARFTNFEMLVEQGALARENSAVTNLKDQQSELEIRISNIESELQSLTRKIDERQIMQAGVEREIDRLAAQAQAARAQIGGAIGNLEEESLRGLGAWETSRAEFGQSGEEVRVALTELERQEQLAIAHQDILQQLQARREALHLRADIDGIVITEDLDLKDGKWFNQGESLFAIAPSKGYDISARVAQGDTELVDEGDRAQFISDTPGVPTVTGRVKAIELVLDDEETAGDKAELEVTIETDPLTTNPDLRLNVKGYVDIRSQKKLNLYQQTAHQIGKVVNLKRYPPFKWFN